MQNQSKLVKLPLFFVSAILMYANTYAATPQIIKHPQSTNVNEGGRVTFAVELRDAQTAVSEVASGNLRLWLKADSGVIIGSSNRVSQWQDFSGTANHCFQTNVVKQPLLALNGFNGHPVIRFDGVQDASLGDFLQGTADVGLTSGFSSFMVYLKANRIVPEEVPILIGIPNNFNAVRTYYVRSIAGLNNEMAFAAWGNDYGTGFQVIDSNDFFGATCKKFAEQPFAGT